MAATAVFLLGKFSWTEEPFRVESRGEVDKTRCEHTLVFPEALFTVARTQEAA